MEASKPIRMPMATHPALTKRDCPDPGDQNALAEMNEVPYQAAVGSLLYAAMFTWPDIAFLVQCISQFNSNPGLIHWAAVKRIFRYLCGTADYCLVLGGDYQNGIDLQGWSDADFARDPDDHRSIAGFAFTFGHGVVSFGSKKQPMVALSMAEAEYMAAATAGREAVWLQTLLHELQLKVSLPTNIFCDNRSAIHLAEEAGWCNHSKHIDIKFHYICELIKGSVVKLNWTDSASELADIFTKPLPLIVHDWHTHSLGIAQASLV